MTSPEALVVPCPLCTQPIKAEARFCKHCRREVTPRSAVLAVSSSSAIGSAAPTDNAVPEKPEESLALPRQERLRTLDAASPVVPVATSSADRKTYRSFGLIVSAILLLVVVGVALTLKSNWDASKRDAAIAAAQHEQEKAARNERLQRGREFIAAGNGSGALAAFNAAGDLNTLTPEDQIIYDKANWLAGIDALCAGDIDELVKLLPSLSTNIPELGQGHTSRAKALVAVRPVIGEYQTYLEAQKTALDAKVDSDDQFDRCKSAIESVERQVTPLRFQVVSRVPTAQHHNAYVIQDETGGRGILLRSDDTVYTSTGWASEHVMKATGEFESDLPVVSVVPEDIFINYRRCQNTILVHNQALARVRQAEAVATASIARIKRKLIESCAAAETTAPSHPTSDLGAHTDQPPTVQVAPASTIAEHAEGAPTPLLLPWTLTEAIVMGSGNHALAIKGLLAELAAPDDEKGAAFSEQDLRALLRDARSEEVYRRDLVNWATPPEIRPTKTKSKPGQTVAEIMMRESNLKAGAEFLRAHAVELNAIQGQYQVESKDVVSLLMWQSNLGRETGAYRLFSVYLGEIVFVDLAYKEAVDSGEASKCCCISGLVFKSKLVDLGPKLGPAIR